MKVISSFSKLFTLPGRNFFLVSPTAMTTYIDDAIANVTAALQETGMWENTVFIFSSGKYFLSNASGD